MQPKNLCASLFVFDGRAPSEVRSSVANALNCTFDEEFAKSDEYGTTWFADALGFEISFKLISSREDGAWYLLTVMASPLIFAPDAPMDEIDFHIGQVLANAGFGTIVTPDEYRAKHHKP